MSSFIRLKIQKTLKLYINGKFVRSESGRVLQAVDRNMETINVCSASRKDLRDTLGAARAAQPGWAARTAYNRGQILYRLAEMLEDRGETLPTTEPDRLWATDRAVHHAGWSDKISAVLSTLNPVAQTYVNYSRIRPVGIVVAVPRPDDKLLGLVEALCAATVMGNAVAVVAPAENAEIVTALAECLATCDMPGGVVNLLTGDLASVVSEAVKMDDLDALYLGRGAIDDALMARAQEENARVMRRLVQVDGATTPATPIELQGLSEVQTVWMSAYEPSGGAAAY